MQVVPTPPPDEWDEDVVYDISSRKDIKVQLDEPGKYSAQEEKAIQDGLLVVSKLGGGTTDKHPGVVMTKHETHTPLQTAFTCYDETNHVTYGKVTFTVRAPMLDIAAFLVDYEARFYRHIDTPNMIKSSVLERVNNHHLVFYYLGRSPPPFQNRDFVWSFIAKQITDDQFVCVLQPALHDAVPITSDTVRAESTRIYRLTRVAPSVTKLELFVTIDLKGSIPSFITNTIVIPTGLSVIEPLYFLHIKEYEDYDKGGGMAACSASC